MRTFVLCLAAAAALSLSTPSVADDCNQGTCENSWKSANSSERDAAFQFAEGYKAFLHTARTELTTVTEAIRIAEAAGFEKWAPGTKVTPGARYYDNNRGRALTLIIGGEEGPSAGMRIVASHIDSPRLELKGRPLYDDIGFGMLQTNYHGGIKTYQWVNIPLALIGRIDKKDGTSVEINVGLKADDPILMIPDLAPHVDRDMRARKQRDVIAHEELDPIIAVGPHGDDGELKASAYVLAYLKDTYGVEAADLVSAELSLVPAMAPRDMGLDRRLVAAYGQDDRLAAYGSLIAATELSTPPQTTVIMFADNEESGNVNNTGASSAYFPDLIAELLYAELGDAYRQPHLARALRASKALSIDVNAGINPMHPGAWEKSNAPEVGYGINIKLYGRGFDANSEFIAWTRAALDARKVPWQTTTYKVGRAGGGTLGRELARYNIDTIDFGVPVLSIHTPYAVSDKLDVVALRDGVKAFIEHK